MTFRSKTLIATLAALPLLGLAQTASALALDIPYAAGAVVTAAPTAIALTPAVTPLAPALVPIAAPVVR